MGLLLTSFFKASFTAPGYVYAGWEEEYAGTDWEAPAIEMGPVAQSTPSVGHRHNGDSAQKLMPGVTFQQKSSGARRYCRKCKVYKPDRSHHCSDCNRCVLKMDHHCPWINNCVGFNNQKYFLLFLMYIPLCGAWIAGTGVYYTVYYTSFNKLSMCYINFLASILVAGTFGGSLLFFWGFHMRLVCDNTTTIEMFEKSDHSFWDIGTWRNVQQVFGPKWYLWPLPVISTPGTGYAFPTSREQVL
jgi:palmitoyltransferase